MCGLPFSGKSTLAREVASATKSKIVSFDELWAEKNMEKPIPQGVDGWRFVRGLALEEIEKFLIAGFSVVYDDANARKEHRQELKEIAKRTNAKGVIVYLNTPIEFIKKREMRNITIEERHQVEEKNFQEVFDQFEVPETDENVVEFRPGTDINQWVNKLPKSEHLS